eukprot:NODE_6099_length_1706_cov_4.528816.p1 GENE.NODE_6099_length_1706_cov_4.528816~~NODE_6099_length_1706_cov_4.528816.p1  ORF type:complete len:387 (-),score=121.18 NODE_6099_length_1706_cov_4.528816:544-1596(-)
MALHYLSTLDPARHLLIKVERLMEELCTQEELKVVISCLTQALQDGDALDLEIWLEQADLLGIESVLPDVCLVGPLRQRLAEMEAEDEFGAPAEHDITAPRRPLGPRCAAPEPKVELRGDSGPWEQRGAVFAQNLCQKTRMARMGDETEVQRLQKEVFCSGVDGTTVTVMLDELRGQTPGMRPPQQLGQLRATIEEAVCAAASPEDLDGLFVDLERRREAERFSPDLRRPPQLHSGSARDGFNADRAAERARLEQERVERLARDRADRAEKQVRDERVRVKRREAEERFKREDASRRRWKEDVAEWQRMEEEAEAELLRVEAERRQHEAKEREDMHARMRKETEEKKTQV